MEENITQVKFDEVFSKENRPVEKIRIWSRNHRTIPSRAFHVFFSASKNRGGIPVCNFMSFLQSITSFLLLCLLSRHQLG